MKLCTEASICTALSERVLQRELHKNLISLSTTLLLTSKILRHSPPKICVLRSLLTQTECPRLQFTQLFGEGIITHGFSLD